MKKNNVLFITTLLITGALLFLSVFAEEKGVFYDLDSFGEYISDVAGDGKKDNASDDVVIQGKSASVTEKEIEQGTQFYLAAGFEEEDARKKAIRHYEELAALYVQAINEGYDVTEEEVTQYTDELRKMFEEDDLQEESREVYESIVKHFDSEEAYWEYEREVYRTLLPIQKMNKNHEITYFDQNPEATSEEWVEYFKAYKDDLVEKQGYKELLPE